MTAPIDWGDEPEQPEHPASCQGCVSGARVNSPLRPETAAELSHRLASGDAPRRKVRRRPADEQPDPTSSGKALDLIRASITAHEAKADEAHDADRHRLSNEHNAIAAGLRIAEAHILANPDAELVAGQRRAAKFQARIDAARAWARQNLVAELEAELLAVLRGGQPAA